MIKIGTDILQINRIEYLYKKYKDAFIKKILTLEEVELINNQNESLFIKSVAKRFAAKEAFSKALGTGIGKECGFSDIIIKHDKFGKPLINLSNKLKIYLENKWGHDLKFELSLTDDYPLALAFVVIYK